MVKKRKKKLKKKIQKLKNERERESAREREREGGGVVWSFRVGTICRDVSGGWENKPSFTIRASAAVLGKITSKKLLFFYFS